MMSKRMFTLSLGFLFVLGLVRPGPAQTFIPRGQAVLEEGALGLTEEQFQKLQDLELEEEKELIPLLSNTRILDLELTRLSYQLSPDLEKIRAKSSELGELDIRIMEIQEKYRKLRRDILTEDQKRIYDLYGDAYGYGYGRGPGFGRGNGWGGRMGPGRGLGRLPLGSSRLGYGRGAAVAPLDRRGYSSWYGLGRGPCGRGLGRYGYRRFRW
jgi:hypothetical protein